MKLELLSLLFVIPSQSQHSTPRTFNRDCVVLHSLAHLGPSLLELFVFITVCFDITLIPKGMERTAERQLRWVALLATK